VKEPDFKIVKSRAKREECVCCGRNPERDKVVNYDIKFTDMADAPYAIMTICEECLWSLHVALNTVMNRKE
jgi:hypothetical protein